MVTDQIQPFTPKDDSSDDFELIDVKEATLDNDALAEIKKWLQPTDYEADSSEYNRHLLSRAPGTGLWICDTNNYLKWHTSTEHGSLWIKGVPGAGKSVTAAAIAKNLVDIEDVPVLKFFFRYIVLANRTPRNLIRDWLTQLLPASTRLQQSLQLIRERELDDFSDEQLWEYLLSGLSSIKKAYCIVDALDEMDIEADYGFLDRLNRLATFRTDAVKVLITSRPKQYLQRALPETSIVHISLERDLVGLDIAQFVKSRMESCLPGSENSVLIENACSAILDRCDGLFLYARLLLDQLIPKLNHGTSANAKDLVASFPVGLESMYNAMLHRQRSRSDINEGIQQFLLEAVTHCARPLRLNELSQALNCAFPDIEASKSKEIVRFACSPLLEILEDETVQVIHHSLTEFLLNSKRQKPALHSEQSQKDLGFPVLDPAAAHKRLSLTCLKYLKYSLTNLSRRARQLDKLDSNGSYVRKTRHRLPIDSSKHQNDPVRIDFQEARLEFPFLEYAARQWAHHAARYDVYDRKFFDAITDFLQPGNEVCLRWMKIEWATNKSDTHMPSILHIAAFAGMTQLARTLEISTLVNTVDGEDRTPLHWASRRGCNSIAALLLENGASPREEDCNGVQPMHEAAKRNHALIVELLLKAGADPTAPKSRERYGMSRYKGGQTITIGETPLQYASSAGHAKTLSAMIPFLSQEQLQEALSRSCQHGRVDSVRCLLKHSDASPNGVFQGGLPIYFAVQALDAATVELLIDHGANVNAFSAWHPPRMIAGGGGSKRRTAATALHELVRVWTPNKLSACFTIFKLLVRAGADLNGRDENGNTPLANMLRLRVHRTGKFDTTILRTLLDAGAQFEDSNEDGVLCRCIQLTDDIRAFKCLIDYGASPEHRGPTGSTVLHIALGERCYDKYVDYDPEDESDELDKYSNTKEEIARYFINQGAKLETKDDDGESALAVAAASWTEDLDLFLRLFEYCSDPLARQQCVWHLGNLGTPAEDIRRYLTILNNAGVSFEARSNMGNTPLLAHAQYSTIVAELVKLGANLNAVDNKGNGILQKSVNQTGWGGQDILTRTRELVSKGLSLHALNNRGSNILHTMAQYWNGDKHQHEFLRYLWDQGLKPSAHNSAGQTMLHTYLGSKQATGSTMKYLLFESQDSRTQDCVHDESLSELIGVLEQSDFDINARDNYGLTPLHLAASKSATGFAYLLKAGADISVRDNYRKTVLHIASEEGNANIAGHILDITGNQLINEPDCNGRTALHKACFAGHLETVDILLHRGANLGAKDNQSRTPLHACAESCQDFLMPQVLSMLLDFGADPKALDISKKTALDNALKEGRKAMVQYLDHKYEDIVELSSLRGIYTPDWSDDDEEKKQELIAYVALLSRREIFLETFPESTREEIIKNPHKYMNLIHEHELGIFWTSGAGSLMQRSELVSSGFLQKAAKSGRIDLMRRLNGLTKELDDRNLVKEVLSERGVVSYREIALYDPVLVSACDRAVPNMIMLKLLVEEHGLDPNVPKSAETDHRGNHLTKLLPGSTSLHILAETHSWWQLKALEYLVSKGADVNAQDNLGRTPLHIASDETVDFNGLSRRHRNRGQYLWKHDYVKLLLELGADPNSLDNFGQTPLHKASASPAVMQTLLDRGASLTAGQTSPIFAAISQQNQQTLKILLEAGCDPNSVDGSGIARVDSKHDSQNRFALFCACFCNEIDKSVKNSVPLIPILLNYVADIYAALDSGETLLHFVFEHAKYPVVKCFMENRRYIDFQRRDNRGRTVLHAACEWRECLPGYAHMRWDPKAQGIVTEMVFSDAAVDIRALDGEGKSMLHHLLDNVDMEEDVILEVLKHPVCKELVGLKDSQGYTAIQYAIKSLRPSLVEVLLDLGADLFTPDPHGATALHHIARHCLRTHKLRGDNTYRLYEESEDYGKKCFKLWRSFLAQGGDLECRDNDGNSPLLVFLASPRVHIVYSKWSQDKDQYLDPFCHAKNFEKYFAGADVFARNKAGERALHVIAKRKRNYFDPSNDDPHDAQLFEFMVKKGLDPLDEDEQGRTALDLAAVHERQKILELYQYSHGR